MFASGLFVVRLIAELKRVRLSYSSADAIFYVLGMLPSSLANYDVIIVSIATILWFLQVRRTQELMISKVAGLSLFRLLGFMLPACCLLAAMFTVNREWFAPMMAEHAKEARSLKASGGRIYFHDNHVWLKTEEGFLEAQISEDAYYLHQIRYFIFNKDHLTRWIMAPKARYHNGKWYAEQVETYKLEEKGQTVTYAPRTLLPITVKPRLISWSFIRPEYLSVKQIAESLVKGDDSGIANNMTWILFMVRVFRPLNLLAVIALTLTILDKATSARFVGLGARLLVVLALALLEFLSYELLCTSRLSLSIKESAVLALLPVLTMVLLTVGIGFYRQRMALVEQ